MAFEDDYVIDDKIGEYQDYPKSKIVGDDPGTYVVDPNGVLQKAQDPKYTFKFQNAPVFEQPTEPKRWVPYTIYKIGDMIMDFFNRLQHCSQYGVSGQYEPMWHNQYGSITHDGGLAWVDCGFPLSVQPIITLPGPVVSPKKPEEAPLPDLIEEREI